MAFRLHGFSSQPHLLPAGNLEKLVNLSDLHFHLCEIGVMTGPPLLGLLQGLNEIM